ncbi:LytTR family transcriptional regulator DNA-binding domain-containing protein [Erysipelothrix rhusiopathiae]|nr:LytTR family transcriptional regulator DNA-binding domain-containing protein [Erysipelothrix rhusiopathiae]MDE8042367.1 LytTR family transcriptional regulator DNA-binding domain-containing protein [Erysipelothrix rhusiopathiae]MDE8049700.1 LytTR family transcriptional regulator DNA-binding domain-containing protein [Erysipelothrix rhusiopathiae]MDE8057569.1 LytTR family transcriptional regulator DNA-binding domain-containing protein [Erysipelothrix rhusiopathiae]MDE8066340.1 LytTR family tra
MYHIAVVHECEDVRHRFFQRLLLIKKCHSIKECFLYTKFEDLQKDPLCSRIDILIISVMIPDQLGIECIHALERLNPKLIVIFISSLDDVMHTVYGTNIYGSMFQENLESTLEETLRAAILKIKNCDQSIIFKTREGVIRLVQNQIKAIIYEKRHPVIYTDAGTYTVMNQSLKSIEASLDELIFVRANHGTIINLRYLVQLSSKELKIINFEESIVIARGRYSKIVSKLKESQGYLKKI